MRFHIFTVLIFILHFIELDISSSTTNNNRSTKEEPIKPHEKRALNYLINEYLLQQDYKVSSITFSDENPDQVNII